jgi:hypothetical protein
VIDTVRRAAPILSTGLVGIAFLFVGVLIGAKTGKTVTIQPVTSYRFQPLADGKALDTKTGRECVPIALPNGASLEDGTPPCPALDSK